jgi:RNA polymerase sigma factor (sigma-70 family)
MCGFIALCCVCCATRWQKRRFDLAYRHRSLQGTVAVQLRKRREDGLDDEAAELIEEPSDDPELALAKVDKGKKLRKCLAGLSREHREVIDLVYYHEKSVEEVARIIGFRRTR